MGSRWRRSGPHGERITRCNIKTLSLSWAGSYFGADSQTSIPNWTQIVAEVKLAAQTFAGIRTESWDVALAEPAPTFLEIDFGGGLNLHRLAQGQGVLDEQYRTHLRRCGYKGRL
jgi:Sugar-transfer associated ATP-grasp